MAEPASLVLADFPSAGVARLRLNRPDARNALNTPLRAALADAFRKLEDDDSVRCAIVCGGDTYFAAGADLKEIVELGPADVYRLGVQRFWKVISGFSKPLIAAVAGPALGGGCELALHADIIVAAKSARLGQPEVRVGVMPGGGATQRLMRSVGKYRAMKLMMTGDFVTGEEAFAMGMVSEVVEDSALEERAVALAIKIAAQPPMAIRLIKEVSLAGADAPLATGLLLERRCFELLFDTADQKEGMTAFAQRRPAEFSGK
ncbi:MAG TPA: enoyl-CoA hydratase-related protein [Pseudolabrys sp.]|nr:enoyl-CoA hydratase-related protein [Pseudolabrys sp.]